ncbi:hypothetical protein CHUAL_007921 [Chamberlinius hualienensis]
MIRHSCLKMLKSLFILGLCVAVAFADTPANCSYPEIEGTWIIQETERSGSNQLNCTTLPGELVYTSRIQLLFPDVAVDESGHEGHWTLIYNQGFEITINQRKYYAFSYYEQVGSNVTSFCDRTFNGWSHDITVRNWACYTANKETPVAAKIHTFDDRSHLRNIPFKNDMKMIEKINSHQKSWTAGPYKKFETKTLHDMYMMAGGPKSTIYNRPSPAPVTKDLSMRTASLPESFDWTDHNGQNFVTPVRDQENCGSCYAFSATAMVEARLKVLTNNSANFVFSPQDVVECSEYAQGCAGGFPYLIGGKYAMDFGFVEEPCNAYRGIDDICHTDETCIKHYTSAYEYIGGFYGACNEEVMKEAIFKGGPISCSFEVYSDFNYYTGGIYHHLFSSEESGRGTDFNPFEVREIY